MHQLTTVNIQIFAATNSNLHSLPFPSYPIPQGMLSQHYPRKKNRLRNSILLARSSISPSRYWIKHCWRDPSQHNATFSQHCLQSSKRWPCCIFYTLPSSWPYPLSFLHVGSLASSSSAFGSVAWHGMLWWKWRVRELPHLLLKRSNFLLCVYLLAIMSGGQ